MTTMKFKKLGLLIVPMIMTMGMITSPAWANEWNGMRRTSSAKLGVRADISTSGTPNYYNSGVPYGGPYSFTTNWVLLADKNAPNYNLAQVGWENQPNHSGHRLFFYGWIRNGTYYETDMNYGPGTGSTHTYTVKYIKQVNGNYDWVGEIDGDVAGKSSINFSATFFEFSEEYYDGSHFIGTSSDPTRFSRIQVLNSNRNWVNVGTLSRYQTTNYGGISYGVNEFDAWDNRN